VTEQHVYRDEDKWFRPEDMNFDILRLLTCGWLHESPNILGQHAMNAVHKRLIGLWMHCAAAPLMRDLFLDSMPFLSSNEVNDISDKECILGYLTSPTGEDKG
jgi:hypothetical protein